MTEYTTPEGTPTAGSASSIITTSIGASEETVSAHLEQHADMFADPSKEVPLVDVEPISDDTVQELTHRELRELMQTIFEQGILKGIPTGQDTALDLINNDPEIDSETKEYITNLVRGGN